jgi:hypothetical protein
VGWEEALKRLAVIGLAICSVPSLVAEKKSTFQIPPDDDSHLAWQEGSEWLTP